MSAANFLRSLADRFDTPGAAWAKRNRIPLRLYQLFQRIQAAHEVRQIFDVGANRGVFASRAAKCFPGVAIHAFEPLPGCQERLARTRQEFPQISIHPMGVGDQIGTIEMFENEYNESSSILPMLDRHRELWPHTKRTQPIKIPITTLDQFSREHSLAGPIFLKIDVQGFELNVLKGAVETLKRVSAVVAEVNFEALYEGQASFPDILNFLSENGLRFTDFSDEMRRPAGGRLIYADAVFERQKAP